MNDTEMAMIYDKYNSAVYRIAFAYCKNSADAEDIMQETFITHFLTNIDFPNDKAEKAWLINVAANKCKDMLRSARYRYLYNSAPLDESILVYETPDESMVYHAVMELPQKYRIVIHLYYYEGYSAAETARIVGCTETAVQTQLYRARRLLKKALGEEFHI